MARSFMQLDGAAYERTLIAKLTGTVDKLRDIGVRLGNRPYRVFVVWTQWTGGVRGDGVEEVTFEEEILPTPRVSELTSLNLRLQSNGLEEVGTLRVTEISQRYTEDYLHGRDRLHEPITDDTDFYWEVLFLHPSDQPIRRRFLPRSVPSVARATAFGWSLDLVRASQDRQPGGAP